MPSSSPAEALLAAADDLTAELAALRFTEPITHVYNPLDYAREPHAAYLRRHAAGPREVLFLGMNPGPWGMAQTGVPFGEIPAVRDWIGIEAPVRRPRPEHPKRPVEGFACAKSEVSGRRLWGLFAGKFGTAEAFFSRHFVANYCPLVFMEASGRNFTPDKLPAAESAALHGACDRHLLRVLEALQPRFLIGVGAYAEACLTRAAALWSQGAATPATPPVVGRVLHPSPASPAANRDWAGTAARQLTQLGVWAE